MAGTTPVPELLTETHQTIAVDTLERWHKRGFDQYRETEFVQYFDLAPTVLDLLDIDYNDARFDGVSLASSGGSRSLDRDAVYAEEGHTARRRTIRTKQYKYIRRLDNENKCRYCDVEHGSVEELYNLRQDPGETVNRLKQDEDIVEKLRSSLNKWIKGLPEPSAGDQVFEPSDQVKEHLDEMGYI